MNKKLFIIIFVFFIVIPMAVCVSATQITESEKAMYPNDGVEQKLFNQFNEDRSVFGVSQVYWDNANTIDVYKRSIEVMSMGINESKSTIREDILVVDEKRLTQHYLQSTETWVDELRNSDHRFRLNELNRDYHNVAIGVSKLNHTYYIVVWWR